LFIHTGGVVWLPQWTISTTPSFSIV
jgi:hypothetical protein